MPFDKPCSAEEQIKLAHKAKAGDRDALARLIASQDGLVRQIAISFGKQSTHIDIDDLIQEAYLAVMDAARWFDASRGFKFSTYSGDCVRRRLFKWLQLRHIVPIGPQEPRPRKSGDNPLENIANREVPVSVQKLEDLLLQLPPLHRAIVRKRHGFEGRPVRIREISKSLGLSRKEERDRYHEAYESLRQAARLMWDREDR